MDVNAYVPCNCPQRGVAKPPPVAVVAREGHVEPAGMLSIEEGAAYQEWCNTACAHPKLHAVDETLGTLDSLRSFTAVLEQAGQPVALLASVMPRGNAGSVDPT